jgi:hypothetical protein
MLYNLFDAKVIILTTSRAPEIRLKFMDIIKSQFKNVEVFVGDHYKDLDEETTKKYLDHKFFHRIPNKHIGDNVILGQCVLALNHMKVLKYIVDNKWDNVLVLEDDSYIRPNVTDLTIEVGEEHCINLSPIPFGLDNIAGMSALFYPSYKKTEEILKLIEDNPKWFKAIDFVLNNLRRKQLIQISTKFLFGQAWCFESCYYENKIPRKVYVNQTELGFYDIYQEAIKFYFKNAKERMELMISARKQFLKAKDIPSNPL